MNDEREKIFARIREALVVRAPRHYETVGHDAPTVGVTASKFRAWLPPVGQRFEEQLILFSSQCDVLKTEFLPCGDGREAAAHLARLAAADGWTKLAFHDGTLTAEIIPHLPAELELLLIVPGYDRDALESCEAGLSECESLVAQTGSVCVSALSSGGRALSVYPPHHIVVARREQLVADLSAAYERLALKYKGNYPSFISFISGPSRTGDIERILVLGAHGPKKLSVLLLP